MTYRHPETGRAYIAVMPSSGAFTEIWYSYHAAARQRIWLDVVRPDDFHELLLSVRDEDVLFLHWAPHCIEPSLLPEDRKALVAAVYSEALDEDQSLMLPDHLRDWRRFLELAPSIDAVFTHTPWMAELVGRSVPIPSFPLPVGWEPEVGRPDWRKPKGAHDVLFAGSMVGRRLQLLPSLSEHLELKILYAVYGLPMNLAMNCSHATLYIAHSMVRSYSTWRIWQAVSSSSALVTEPGDFWPMPSECCFPIEHVTSRNVSEIARFIRSLSPHDTLAKASSLHDALRFMTTSNCIDTYVVEAAADLSR
jgi:hypothetical protein